MFMLIINLMFASTHTALSIYHWIGMTS